MDNLSELQSQVRKFHKERSWSHHPKEIAIDISLEAAELLEHFKWRNGKELDIYIEGHRQDIEDELSDVLHATLLLAQSMNIDLMKAFAKKMKKNNIKYPVKEEMHE